MDTVAGGGAAAVWLAGQVGYIDTQRVSGGGDERLRCGLVTALDLSDQALADVHPRC